MSLKLDMRKTYNRVEWGYIEKVLTTLGFDFTLVKLIINCVKSASFSILINGVPKGHIKPRKGLKQGDLLFSYLFLMCTEGLVELLKMAATNKHVPGIKICRGPHSLIIFTLLKTM